MAQRRLDLGGLTAVAILLALVVVGCGGGGSSASTAASTDAGASLQVEPAGEAGSAPSVAAKESTSNEAEGAPSAAAEEDSAAKSGSKDNRSKAVDKKKHPPLALPTGEPEHGPTEAQRAKIPTADLKVALGGGKLTAANTCDGENSSPAIEWGGIPSGTAELALFVMNVHPVDGKLYFDWAVAGIDPSATGLKAGALPEDAVIGRNGEGQDKYSLCPPDSGKEVYVFALYALPRSLAPKQGFEPFALRSEAMHTAESVGLYAAEY
jgi:phosphatidylethanolamine-binding protein (PEBP) family uncharacterized protein